MSDKTARAVRFDHYGDRDVLYVAEIPMPSPQAGEVVVEVRAAGTNPGEAAIRSGALAERFPATFPSGEGSDLAGVVSEVGPDVEEFAVGDEVLGFSWNRSSQASYVVACTAYAAVRAVDPRPGETVAVSAAAGGVGTVVVQLLGVRDARVLGIASEANAAWLTTHGAIFVPYGDGLAARLAAAAPEGINAFIDLFGPEYLDVAVELGIARDRIETITSFARAAELGTKADGSGTASTKEVLSEMAQLVASGVIEIPIAATYPLERVGEAYAQLEQRHTRGKIVLIP
jgi:NADPH2:quinone reductase